MTSRPRALAPTSRRDRFDCARCSDPTDAFPETARADARLCRKCFGKRTDKRPHDLNDLTGALWARYSKSVEDYPDTRTPKQRQHGACFPRSLALQQIEIFTKPGQTVLDPFVGVGTTLEAAMALRRNGVGIELNADFAKAARHDLRHASKYGVTQRVIVDDARKLATHLQPHSADFLLTSPPYATLLKTVRGTFAYKWREHSTLDPRANPPAYSSRPQDLGNMHYDAFMDAVRSVMAQSRVVLRPGSYSVWVVKDYRDLRNKKPYVNFHGDMIAAAESTGFSLWDIRIYDQTKFRPLVCLGYPSRNFYLNIGHSYLLTFKNL